MATLTITLASEGKQLSELRLTYDTLTPGAAADLMSIMETTGVFARVDGPARTVSFWGVFEVLEAIQLLLVGKWSNDAKAED